MNLKRYVQRATLALPLAILAGLCNIEAAEGAEPVRFSHSDFGFVVQTLDDAAGKQLLSPEVVEDRFAQ